MIQLLFEITCNLPDNLIPTFINTNFYNALPLAIYKSIGFESVEKMCIKFESITNKIYEANALTMLKNILFFTKTDYNYNEENILIYLFNNGPLHWICMSGNPKVAKIIINHFNLLYFNHTNQQNKTGLYYLIGKETSKIIDIINILLDHGLDINFTPKNGNSILTEFVFDVKPDLEVINFLLKNGADWNTMTTQNKTLYERIIESVDNSFFYVQSQTQIKHKILEIFEYYKEIEERRKIEEEKQKQKQNEESQTTKEEKENENEESQMTKESNENKESELD